MFLFHAAWGITNVIDCFWSEVLQYSLTAASCILLHANTSSTVKEQGTYTAMHKSCDNSAHEQVKLLCMNLPNKEGLLYSLLKEETFLNVIFNIWLIDYKHNTEDRHNAQCNVAYHTHLHGCLSFLLLYKTEQNTETEQNKNIIPFSQ